MHVKSSDTTELNRGCSYSQWVLLFTVDVLIHSGFSYTQWVFLYTVGVIRDLTRNTKHYFIRLVTNQRALTIWLRQNFATSTFYIAVNHEENHCVSYLLHSRMVIHPGMGPKPSNVQCIIKFIYVSCIFIDMANKRKRRHLANGVHREQRNMNSRFIVLCGVSVGQMRNSEKPANNTCRYSVLIFINLQMT